MEKNSTTDSKKTLKSIICNVFTSGVTIIVSLISTVVITRIITVADLGIASSFNSLKSILTIICLLSVYISINRMILDIDGNDYEYLSSIYIFSSLFCIFMYIIYIIFRSFFNNIFGFDTKMMTLMFSIIFMINGGTILTNYWNFKNKYKLLFINNLLSSPISQIISLVLSYVLSSHKYLGRIIGIETFNIIFGLIYGIIILVKGKFSFNIDYIRKTLHICIPMIPHLLAQIMLTSCDLLMIRNIAGNNAAGVYSMAYTISNILYLILIQLLMPWSPWVYRRMKNNEIETIEKNSKLLTTLCWFLCLGLFTISPEMIKLCLGKEYYEASFIIAPICVGIFFEVMYIYFYDIEYFYKKNKQIAIFSVIAALLNLLLNYIFINKFGYKAAAYTTFFSYFVLFVLHYFEMKRIEKRKIYDVKFIMVMSLILTGIACIYILTNNNIFVRYLVLIFSTVLIFVKNKKILLNIIKNRKLGDVLNDK